MKEQTWKKFKKGDLIITENGTGFPAVVYENQKSKDYISIYAFGWCAEHGSEYPERAVKVENKQEWFALCKSEGHTKEAVLKIFKLFKIAD